MRIAAFFITFVLTVMLPWWLVVPLWALYVLVYDGYELVVFGVCMDAYVGIGGVWSMLYTSAATVIVICGLLIRPRLAFYRD